MKKLYWNLWSPTYGFKFGQSFETRKECESYIPTAKANLERCNAGRIANGYQPIVWDWEIVQTEIFWTLDIPFEVMKAFAEKHKATLQ